MDGTKIHANANWHSALSYEHAGKIEAQLKAEVADLMGKAEAADVPDGLSIPDELGRREERLRKLAEAKAKIGARVRERHAASEPVFGIVKSVLGFRQFPLRGLDTVRGERSLVTMAGNSKRMFAVAPPEGPHAPSRP